MYRPKPARSVRDRRRLGSRGTGRESRERVVAERIDRLLCRVEPHRDDDVRLRCHIEESEPPRHDADNLPLPRQRASAAAGWRLHRELAPERRLVTAESPLPERIRENDALRPVGRWPVLFLGKPAPAHRLHPERLQSAVRNSKSAHLHRLTAVDQRRPPSRATDRCWQMSGSPPDK